MPRLRRLSISLMTSIALMHGPLLGSPAFADPDASPRLDPPSAGHIALALDRLAVAGTVLYVAAHPDDENTRLLAWLANARGLRAAYVSLTRGDGGQNLIGSELGPLLGLIRTHELLAARRIDGAEQYFTRAIDFGYSKRAEETLAIWGEDAVLGDLTRVVRHVRPDVIVTRFSIDPPNHGHHTASALLAREAFVAAADPARFPEQLAHDGLRPHQAQRLFENKSPWRFKKDEDLSRYLALDVGGRSPELGRTYAELAAQSRTMHKSQGFGSAPAHGPLLEYFEPTIPERWPRALPAKASDPLAGLDFSWARFPGTAPLVKAIAAARKAFDPAHPERLLPHLSRVHAALLALPEDNPYRAPKLAELHALVLAVAGLHLEARAASPVAISSEPLAVDATAIAYRDVAVEVALTFPDGHLAPARTLVPGTPATRSHTLTPSGSPSTPYWLAAPSRGGLFTPAEGHSGIEPTGASSLAVRFAVTVKPPGAVPIAFEVSRPLRHTWVDRVHGERFREVELLPALTVTPLSPHRMFPGPAARTVELRVRAHGQARRGEVSLGAPPDARGWKITPSSHPFELPADGEAVFAFDVTPAGTAPVELRASATAEGRTFDRAEAVIDYLHVPRTTILSPATVRAVPLDLAIGGAKIGYLVGAGDEIPQSLTQVGYQVTLLDPAALGDVDLASFSAIVAGIRAHNVHPALRHLHPALMRYVEGGGTYLVQYITSTRHRPLGDVPIGPHPFVIDQGRVTDETAALTALDPKHPALTTPNRIEPADFSGWVQERGLYFAASWDERYTPLFAAADPGEDPLQGSTLVARHGKGAFIYTGLAFFRQLPEGVPGAYRLFANLLALGAPAHKGAGR